MKIEEQLTSLEISKQLKKLGIKQDSLWYWARARGSKIYQLLDRKTAERLFSASAESYSAYTFAEISSMLPATLECNDDPYEPCDGIYIQTGKERDGTWNCNDGDYCAKSKRIVDAPAKMILYLLSEGCYYDDEKFLEWKAKILEK